MKEYTKEDIELILNSYRADQSSRFVPDSVFMPESNARQLCKEAGLTEEQTEQFLLDHTVDMRE